MQTDKVFKGNTFLYNSAGCGSLEQQTLQKSNKKALKIRA